MENKEFGKDDFNEIVKKERKTEVADATVETANLVKESTRGKDTAEVGRTK